MKVIKDLQEATGWKIEGYVIGEWGASFELNLKTKESKSSEPRLLNRMHLTPEQSVELLAFLLSNVIEIQRLCAEDRLKYEAGIKTLLDILYELREDDKLKSDPSGS